MNLVDLENAICKTVREMITNTDLKPSDKDDLVPQVCGSIRGGFNAHRRRKRRALNNAVKAANADYVSVAGSATGARIHA